MDSAQIQSRIYKGYGHAARHLGQNYNVFRPSSASNPLGIQNRISTVHASFNAQDMNYRKPNVYGKALWYALLDAKDAKAGDYLVGTDATYFIAALQPLLPILAVQCNRTVTVYRPQIQTGIGAVGYGGNTTANETPVMTGWPCSILQGTKGEKAETNLPGDARSPWWVVLLPYFAGVNLLPDDIITDDLGRRYVISSPEKSELGWRLTAMMAVP